MQRDDLTKPRRAWSNFESALFNLVSTHSDRRIPGYFTARLRVCNQMLKAYDEAIDKLEVESKRRTNAETNRK